MFNIKTAIKLIGLLSITVFMATACSFLQPTPSCEVNNPPYQGTVDPIPYPDDAIIIENKALVCFYTTPSTNTISAGISGANLYCFSSSCTKVFERTGGMKIDQDNHTIQFYSRFVVQDLQSRCVPCTADCGGAGALVFEIRSILDGTYSIKLGNTELGRVQFPLSQSEVCLDIDK